jgi:prephenate dehydrogenase
MPRPPRMLLLGAGLSGGLLALALAELGVEVELAGGSLADSATGWS